MSMTERRRQGGYAILEVAREHTGKPLTISELATLCGRVVKGVPDSTFGLDLAAARHIALDCDERITECAWDRGRGERVLFHLLPDREEGKGADGLIVHARDNATRSSNLRRHAEWEKVHAYDPIDRKFASIAAKAGRAGAEYGLALQEMSDLIRDLRGKASSG